LLSEPTETLPTIPDEEYADRGRRLQSLVAEEGLDVLLVNSSESDFANVRYLTDYWPVFEFAGVVVPPDGPLTLLIGPESETFARDRSRLDRIRMLTEYRESADPDYPDIEVDTYAAVFSDAGVASPRRIGIGGSFATNYIMLEELRRTFPDAELVRADGLLTTLRSVKSEAELACLRAAFRISEEAIGDILEVIRPGMAELQVVGVAQEAIYRRGAEYEGMVQYVMSGRNSRHAISRASYRVLRAGEVVQLNISARVAGYSSGVGRPIVLGRLDPEQRKILDFGLEAHHGILAPCRRHRKRRREALPRVLHRARPRGPVPLRPLPRPRPDRGRAAVDGRDVRLPAGRKHDLPDRHVRPLAYVRGALGERRADHLGRHRAALEPAHGGDRD
jgi:Xaa-Pro aminopeptidase